MSMDLTPDELAILEAHRPTFAKLDYLEQKQRLIEITRQMVALDQDGSHMSPADAQTKIKQEYSEILKPPQRKGRQAYRVGRSWDARRVFAMLHSTELDKLVENTAMNELGIGAAGGADDESDGEDQDDESTVPLHDVSKKNWIRYRQACLTKLMDKLSEEEKVKYHTLAHEWNSTQPPADVQRHYVQSNLERHYTEFATAAFKNGGVRMHTICSFINADGKVCTFTLDANPQLGKEKFEKLQPQWQQNTLTAWGTYSKAVFLGDSALNPTELKQITLARKKSPPKPELEIDEHGIPILKPWKKGKDPNTLEKRAILRAFLSQHYATASGSKRPVPWSKLTDNHESFIMPQYLPDAEIIFKDPVHMAAAHIDLLFNHWFKRIEEGLYPFSFLYIIDPESGEAIPSAKSYRLNGLPLPVKDGRKATSFWDKAHAAKSAQGKSQPETSRKVGTRWPSMEKESTPRQEPTPEKEPTPQRDPTPEQEPMPQRDSTLEREPMPQQDPTPEQETTTQQDLTPPVEEETHSVEGVGGAAPKATRGKKARTAKKGVQRQVVSPDAREDPEGPGCRPTRDHKAPSNVPVLLAGGRPLSKRKGPWWEWADPDKEGSVNPVGKKPRT